MTDVVQSANTPIHPKVSVCVITYNQEEYIRQCLDSLVSQTPNFAFEIVVGDDCSTDRTRDIVEEFVARYPLLVRTNFQPRNTGGSRNNLEVHAIARGDYVAHMDGDDYALPGKLQAQADALDGDIGCNAVWHPVDFFDDKGGFCSGTTADLSSFKDGLVRFEDSIRTGYISVFSSLMYRRSARIVPDPSRNMLDLYFTWDLLSNGYGRVLPIVLGRYRVSSTGSLQAASLRRVELLALDHASEFLTRFPQHRSDFLIWALTAGVVAAKSRRRVALDYFRFSWHMRTWVWPSAITSNIHRVRQARVKWRDKRTIAPASLLQSS